VQKFAHRISEKLNLGRPEVAILCELMLRGPQTLGELRTRAERMHAFDGLEQVQSVIDRLPELIIKLERRPGEKESRFAHLLSGPPAVSHSVSHTDAGLPTPPRHDRIATLETEVAQLRQELEDLKQQFAGFMKQFE
jgi:uncharacterized protein YceH (UPF0502 family)